MDLPRPDQLVVERLGPSRFDSPLDPDRAQFVDDDEAVLCTSRTRDLAPLLERGGPLPAFERGGPRRRLFFPTGTKTRVGIVTCGGLCPGLNDVVRALVLTAWHYYGIRDVLGFRFGYLGMSSKRTDEPMPLEPADVDSIHHHGGSLLGSSRGPQDLDDMCATLAAFDIDILFTIGGDGTLRGASALARRLRESGQEVAVVGIPKTIDNDISWVVRSFGFSTAVDAACEVLRCAHEEARGALNGIGLVKLMGRESGSIAATAALANGDANFCLVPEFPMPLDGDSGLLHALEHRLSERRHALIAVAEGFGQDLLRAAQAADGRGSGSDASGNTALGDIGVYLKHRINEHFGATGVDVTVKYIDPSYIIRSIPANALDSELCLRMGQNAVHSAMAGCTDVMVGFWNATMTHVPLPLATSTRRRLTRHDATWRHVVEATGQTQPLPSRQDPSRLPTEGSS